MGQLGDAFNMKGMTTAEDPWHIGVCKCLNAVIVNVFSKVISYIEEMALTWTLSAYNALNNYSGFSFTRHLASTLPSLKISKVTLLLQKQ